MSTTPQKTIKTNPDENLTLTSALENILYALDNNEVDASGLAENVEKEYDYICSTLDINRPQANLLAGIIEISVCNSATADAVAKRLGCSNIRFLHLKNEIDSLVEKRYIRINNGYSGISYYIPDAVLDSIQKNQKPDNEDITGLSTNVILKKISNEMKEFWRTNIEFASLKREVRDILRFNDTNEFVKTLNSKIGCELDFLDLLAYLYMVVRYCFYNETEFTWNDFSRLYEEAIDEDEYEEDLENGHSGLHTFGLIEFVNNNGIVDNTHYCLSSWSVNLLANVKVKKDTRVNNQSIIGCDSIKQKPLFYSEDIEAQIDTLTNLLQKDSFDKVVERLSQKGMRTGFNVIFSGPAGTGKTESVYQIAKKTGRNIFLVDFASLKSKWVGDSEKQVKALFDDYRNMVKSCELCPILLFNEADGIFSIRKRGAESAVDKMENTIQNIILQEMENLEGIMIATTNLTCNFDSAFERRFIYKVQFNKPDIEAKTKIWESMVEGLSEDNARVLAKEYDFSGGQIENISRKMTIDYILYGKAPEIENIKTFCDQECFGSSKKERPRIGF